MIRTIKPLGNNVLASRIEPPKVSPGGIHFIDNDNYRDDKMQWRVLAVGPKVQELQAGDRILTPMYYGNKLVLEDGTERHIIGAEQVIAFWRNEGQAQGQSQ